MSGYRREGGINFTPSKYCLHHKIRKPDTYIFASRTVDKEHNIKSTSNNLFSITNMAKVVSQLYTLKFVANFSRKQYKHNQAKKFWINNVMVEMRSKQAFSA